jgi:hypothetical protein
MTHSRVRLKPGEGLPQPGRYRCVCPLRRPQAVAPLHLALQQLPLEGVTSSFRDLERTKGLSAWITQCRLYMNRHLCHDMSYDTTILPPLIETSKFREREIIKGAEVLGGFRSDPPKLGGFHCS